VSEPTADNRNRSEFQVLARRYRPQTFQEVAGQESIVRTLRNALEAGRIAHAYLFCGTRGVGKTSMARLLAKALNCEKGPTTEPCNQCAACREVTACSSVDVLEIDGASHNKVDDVRDLQDSLTYQPVRDRYRVVIIDEVHMLSRSAFNALLKTLEEPPAHVVFVLATTELEKIPATILSRCQHYTFRRISRREILEQLEKVATREKLEVSRESLALVARQASGSLRDGLSALDQLVSFCSTSMTDEDVETVLGALPAGRVDALLRAVADNDAGAALGSLRASEERGDDPARFAEALLARLRDLTVLKTAGEATALVEAGEEEREELLELAHRFGDDDLLRLFQLAGGLESALRHTRHPRSILELAALKMVKAAELTPLPELAVRLMEGGATPSTGGGSRPGPAPARGSGSRATASPGRRSRKGPEAAPAAPATGQELDLDRLRAAVERSKPAVAAFLEHAEGAFEEGAVCLSFQPKHSFFKKSLEMPANRDALVSAARAVFGPQIVVRLGLAERDRPAPEAPRETDENRRRRLMQTARDQPAIRSLEQVFGAEIVDIKPIEPGETPPRQEAES
jgi:DNA polymerase-3 subunit gamma/tau